MINDPYIRRAQEALDAAKAKAKVYRGDCSACIHREGSMSFEPRCNHPAVKLVAFNLTDAYAKGRIVTCDEQRDARSVYGPVVCGPNGALFDDGKSPPAAVAAMPAVHQLEREPHRRTFLEWLYDLFVGKPA